MKTTVYTSVQDFIRDLAKENVLADGWNGEVLLRYDSGRHFGNVIAKLRIADSANEKILKDFLDRSFIRGVVILYDGTLNISKSITTAQEGIDLLSDWLQVIRITEDMLSVQIE